MNALTRQPLRSHSAAPHHCPCGNQGHVAALPQYTRPADLQFGARGVHRQRPRAADAQVHRPVKLGHQRNPIRCFSPIRRHDHRHAGQRAQVGNIADRVVRRPILEVRDAGITGSHLDVGMRVANACPDLLQCP